MRTRTTLLAFVLVAFAFALPARADDGWQSVDSIEGLGGSFTRPPLAKGPIAFMTLTVTKDYDGQRVDGTYTRFYDAGKGALTIQTGTFSALPNNPAIGPFIAFFDENGDYRDGFWILGIKRDPLGKKIIALELANSGDGSSFVLTRVGL